MSKTRAKSGFLAVFLAVFVVAAGCGGADAGSEPSGGEPPVGSAEAAVTTGNPYEHGYTDADYPRVIELARDVYAYEQIHAAGGEIITTVSLFVVTPEGVLVADGQENPEETQRLIDTIAGITDRPITHVVIASDHGDHTAGNSAFPSSAVFLAHPTSAATLEASAANPRRSADAPPIVQPTDLVERDRVLELGGREIRILHLGRAHTGGDLVVYVPEGKVLFMSETYMKGIFPPMRSAFPSEWVEMVRRAQEMDVDVYVPGHGVMESPEILRAGLESYRQAMERVIAEATRLHEQGLSLEAAVEAASFGDIEGWSLSESQAPRAIGRVYMELDGELPQ